MSDILFLENLPGNFDELYRETIDVLRQTEQNGQELHGGLDKTQQGLFDKVARVSLATLVENPEAAMLLGKFGAAENIFVVNIAEVDDAILRVHFYTQEGVKEASADELQKAPARMNGLGTPHHHAGDCAAVIPQGQIVHHWFTESEGADYTAGEIDFTIADDPTKEYQFRTSHFVPDDVQTGLQYLGTDQFDRSQGHWMDHQAIHIVTWLEPTISLFLNDMKTKHTSIAYERPRVREKIERPRHLTVDERDILWGAFVDLANSTLDAH